MALTPYTPVTKFRILAGVPLDNSYSDTLTFSSVSSQVSYFASKTKSGMSWDNFGILSPEGNFRVPVEIDKLYDCNYVMWQNSNFNSKWFFGFIKKLTFKNVNMTILDVELDVMQTWYFDYQLNQCWIEREHVNDDVIGAHLEAENFDLGEYVVNNTIYSDLVDTPTVSQDGEFSNWRVCFLCSSDIEGGYAPGEAITRMYTGLHLHAFRTVTGANAFVESLTNLGKEDSIVCCYMVPNTIYPDTLSSREPYEILTTLQKPYTSINGYIPKNNKLFTYPFCFLNVSNSQGNHAQYRYEYFSNSSMVFSLAGSPLPDSELVCYPHSYKGMDNNVDEKITINGYPTCAYATDYYKAWLAQNKSSQAVSLMGTALTITGALIGTALTGGAMAPALVGATTTGIMSVSNLMAEHEKAQVIPPQASGTQSGSTMFGLGIFNFIFEFKSITYNFAKKIDDYFSMFGYRVNDFGIPNRTGRQNWNYVKTVGSNATGSIPFGDMAKINSIYDAGITFWHTKDVGNYSLSNNVVGG